MTQFEITIFLDEIERLVFQKLQSGISNFSELLKSLPGIYPTSVLDSIQRLISKKQIDESLIEKLFIKKRSEDSISKSIFPTPHPLDYHWKFTEVTRTKLLNKAYELTKSGEVIGLVGTPSLLEKYYDYFNERDIVLFDKNALDGYSNKFVKCTSYQRDLLCDSVPVINANVVIADPPWYPEYFQSFLWSASKICCIDGHLLLSIPTEGTRPNIKKELTDLFSYAKKVGFSCIKYEKSSIQYNMPQFEHNALLAEGFHNISKDWRIADLAIFSKIKQLSMCRPIFKQKEKWTKIIINSIDFRIRTSSLNEYQDPTLIPLVKGEIFPSVSRRDPRRKLADVWTSGNRVYVCKGNNILICILRSIQENASPIQRVSTLLGRKLQVSEITQILITIKKINEIITREIHEL